MNDETPETTREHEDGFARESEDPAWDRSGRSWGTIAAVIGVLVAGGVAAFLLFSDSDSDLGTRPQQQPTPAERLACPHLLRAAEAFEQGDQAEFDHEIDQAAEIAEKVLDTSGQAFGQPERIALELNLGANTTSSRIERLLEDAVQDCEEPESP